VRQGSAVDALGAQHVDIVLLGQLVRREGLRRAVNHVAGVVDDDVEAPGVRQHMAHRRFGRGVRQHVQFDRAKVGAVFRGPCRGFSNLGGIAPGRFQHRGVDGVAGLSQCTGGHEAEA